jgi:hypothetical protein
MKSAHFPKPSAFAAGLMLAAAAPVFLATLSAQSPPISQGQASQSVTVDPNALPQFGGPGAGTSGLPGIGAMAPGGQAQEELRDIAPPVDVPFWNWKTVTAAALAGLGSLAAAIWTARRWMLRARPAPPPPDPVQVALKALDALRGVAGEKLSDRDFAAAAAEVLRGFLEAKHGLNAPRQTTEEFLSSVQKSHRFAENQLQLLRSFLGQCDMIKFAKGVAGSAARIELLLMAERTVRGDIA